MGALLAALALTAAGCGGSPSEGGSASGAPREGKKGGKVTFPAAADVDYLDPGQTYYTFGYTVAYATNRPLYSFEPDDAETPVPDLAEGEPLISADNRTITVKLRPGVRFSPPVNREVTAADVKYAFERAFTRNVPSGYATSYFADITGAPDAPGAFRSIAGIKAPTTARANLGREYMLEARAEGVPVSADGRYTGPGDLLTVAANADPGLQTATVAQGQLEQLGFELNFRKVPQDTLYTRFCNVPGSDYAICPNVGWFRDFTDPQSVLEPTFKGAAIKPRGNVNYSLLDDPAIRRGDGQGGDDPAGAERNRAWAEINKRIVSQAPAVPYAWDDSFQIAAKDVQGVMNGYTTTWDLAYSSLK